jgi:hypothetical protein
MSMRKAVKRLAAAALPWPGRHQRKAAIEAARAEADKSRHSARAARAVAADLERMRADNHFALSIAHQITRHRSQGS